MNIRAKIFGTGDPAEPVLRAKRPKGTRADELHSVSVPREESRRRNNRGADRHRLSAETVAITANGVRHEVELVNLSGGGAMIAGWPDAQLWQRVDLHLGENGTIECAVCWVRDGRAGLEFAHETQLDCSDDERAQILREAISRSFPDMAFEAKGETAEPDASGDEQRRARRHPLVWSGTLHHDYQSTPVRVRNISASGAMLQSEAPVRCGSEPLLELACDLSLSGTVTWAVGDQLGLRFHSPFDLALLGRSTPEVTAPRWERPDYLSKVDALGSPWDPRWQRQSVGELRDELEGFLKR